MLTESAPVPQSIFSARPEQLIFLTWDQLVAKGEEITYVPSETLTRKKLIKIPIPFCILQSLGSWGPVISFDLFQTF